MLCFVLFNIIIACTSALENVNVIQLRLPFNEIHEFTVNETVEYMVEFVQDNATIVGQPARVFLSSDDANILQPVLVSARHHSGAAMWQLPYTSVTPSGIRLYNSIEKTLCPHNNIMTPVNDTSYCDEANERVTIIHISSTCSYNLTIMIKLQTVDGFYLPLDTNVIVDVAPNTPTYYFYSFDFGPLSNKIHLESFKAMFDRQCGKSLSMEQALRLDELNALRGSTVVPPRVRVVVESDDDLCATVSIQSYSCPVFDTEREILYEGLFMTMTRLGSIQLPYFRYPNGFYVVLMVRETDNECSDTFTETNRTITNRIIETRNVTERRKTFRFRIEATISYEEYVVATLSATGFFIFFYITFVSVVLCLRWKVLRNLVLPQRSIGGQLEVEESGPSPMFNGTQANQTTELDNTLELPSRLRLTDLARHRAEEWRTRSQRYLWTVLTVAVFYSLPVVQLVATYQRILNSTGDQDLCYYNFLCAHPLGVLSDFNHVTSNMGYIFLGILFIVQVARKQRNQRHRTDNEEFGIPQHYGLLYSLGVALFVEGVLSGSYHLCPNKMNFQFDMAFMYVMAVLCMVKIFQSRHPDINAQAHATFAVLAVLIVMCLFGVLSSSYIFWVVFTILHLMTFLLLSLQIYYIGRFKLERVASRKLISGGPLYVQRLILLVIANVANWIFAAYGLWSQSTDFASYLLMLLLGNLSLYTIFYLVMKLLHKEPILTHSWIFILLAILSWPPALYFFVSLNSNWATTPALSRELNANCDILSFYDSHDIWHFLSAVAMFASFNMLLTWDDGLSRTPRHMIDVF